MRYMHMEHGPKPLHEPSKARKETKIEEDDDHSFKFKKAQPVEGIVTQPEDPRILEN